MDRNPYSNGRAGEGTRPYGENRTVAVGSAEPGAVVEPQQRQFLQTQGPVARMEPQKAAQILRAGNFAQLPRYASPVTGVLGDGSLVTFWPPRKSLAAGAAKLPP